MKRNVLKGPDFIYMYMWHLGTWFRADLAVLGQQLASMNLKFISNLNYSDFLFVCVHSRDEKLRGRSSN